MSKKNEGFCSGNLNLHDIPVHDEGQTVVRGGKTWRMTPRAALEGAHDGCIKLAIARWTKRGYAIPCEECDVMQTARMFLAKNISAYDRCKGPPSAFVIRSTWWVLCGLISEAAGLRSRNSSRKRKGFTVLSLDAFDEEKEAIMGPAPIEPQDEMYHKKALARFVLEGIDSLEDDRQRLILSKRIITLVDSNKRQKRVEQGPNSGRGMPEYSLDDLAVELGVTRERIRQIQEDAIYNVQEYVKRRSGCQRIEF